MGDKEILTACLNSHKDLAHQYLEAANHTDDQQLLHALMSLCQEEQQARLQIYNAMHQRGWYNPAAIDQQQVQKLQQTMNQTRHELRQLSHGQQPFQGSPYFQPSQSQQAGPFQQAGQYQPSGQHQHPGQYQQGQSYNYAGQQRQEYQHPVQVW